MFTFCVLNSRHFIHRIGRFLNNETQIMINNLNLRWLILMKLKIIRVLS